MYPRESGSCNIYSISDALIKTPVTMTNVRKKYPNAMKGDLFVNSDTYNTYIYNGINLLYLDYTIDDYGGIPPYFHVIENNVPIRYWDAIEHNSIVWFNHNLVKVQCIQNITYGNIDSSNYGLYTTFRYMDITYLIVYDIVEEALYGKGVSCIKGTKNISGACITKDSKIYSNYKFRSNKYKNIYINKLCKLFASDRLFPFSYSSTHYHPPDPTHTLYIISG